MRKIVLVSCVGKKMLYTNRAADLYQSTWFKKARAYAEMIGDQWYILSALYGLIPPGQAIEPYDLTLNTMSKPFRQVWAKKVLAAVESELDPLRDELIILAGKRYREFLVPQLEAAGFTIHIPMEGLKIGQQLQWLSSEMSAKET
jgi:cytoplasmic iron level regulating protein YaaA (DUF328/UPF0246 family)